MNVLIIGGSGNISWHFTEKVIAEGASTFVLNRRQTVYSRRRLSDKAILLEQDINDEISVKRRLANLNIFFDVVIDFLCYKKEDAIRDIRLFSNITEHYVYIGSSACYKREGYYEPITEDRELNYKRWDYIKGKIECEEIFKTAYKNGFPVTIVRPGHTYDTLLPDAVGNGDWTIANRIIHNKPIIIHGDGTNWWTITHSKDFANALYSVICDKCTIGDSFHITGDEVLDWNYIVKEMCRALGKDNPQIVHIPTDKIAECNQSFADGIIEHKMWNDIYSNKKIKDIASGWTNQILYKDGIRKSINWLLEDKRHQRINNDLDKLIDKIIES